MAWTGTDSRSGEPGASGSCFWGDGGCFKAQPTTCTILCNRAGVQSFSCQLLRSAEACSAPRELPHSCCAGLPCACEL